MITSEFNNMRIVGVAGAVPTKRVAAHDYDELFGEKTVEKNMETTGVCAAYHAAENQTASDLGYVAAKRLMNELDIDPASIDVLIFTAAYLDYFVPPTSCVLQHRLGLNTDCMVFDTNLGCSGYVYALQTMCSTLNNSSAKRGLLINGDVTSRIISPQDKSRMLFGDGGTATIVEKCDEEPAMRFGMRTDGSRFKSIIVPAGAQRNRGADRQSTEWGDGNIRSDYHLFMNGTGVFSFTMTDVPKLVKEFYKYYEVSAEDYDAFVFHQPNLFILKHLAKKIKAPLEKMPITLDRYGNTSVCAIPMTICDTFGEQDQGEKRLFLYGFGVGLSWAIADVVVDTSKVFEIEHTDDYYKDGAVSHEV